MQSTAEEISDCGVSLEAKTTFESEVAVRIGRVSVRNYLLSLPRSEELLVLH